VVIRTRQWRSPKARVQVETELDHSFATMSSDVFQDDQPVLVDGDLIEAAKENIQPLASGRRATALSAVLSTPHAQRESKLAAARNRLRINVEIALEDEDDNPLEAYCRLVYWTLENYPQGHSAESGLLELLEEATRVLKDHRGGVWRDDLRYLKLWVLYANYVEKPTVIYRFLLANEIGTSFALLYEEFATVLERNGRCAAIPLVFPFYHFRYGYRPLAERHTHTHTGAWTRTKLICSASTDRHPRKSICRRNIESFKSG